MHKLRFTFFFLIYVSFGYCQTFNWVKGFGGNSNDASSSINTDYTGNIYTTGKFTGTIDLDPGPGVFNSYGHHAIFMQKLSPKGDFLWARTIDGKQVINNRSTVVDSLGNIFSTGGFFGKLDFDPGPDSLKHSSHGFDDIYIHKMNSNGDLVWVKRIGGPGSDEGNFVFVDHLGDLYITGVFSGTVDFDPGPDTFNLASSSKGAFILKLDSLGDFIWAKGINGSISPNLLTIDGFGNIYTSGLFTDTVDFDPGPSLSNLTSLFFSSLYILKINSSGNFVWAKKFASPFMESTSMNVDSEGNIISTGHFRDEANFDPGWAQFYVKSKGYEDVYILKMDSSGNFLWVKSFGGKLSDRCYSSSLDKNGNIISLGVFGNKVDFDTSSDSLNILSKGIGDIFIHRIDNQGNFISVNTIGGDYLDIGTDLTLDYSGNIITTGYFKDTVDFNPSSDTFNLTSLNFSNDIFVLKLNQCPYSGSNLSVKGNTITVNNQNATYQWLDCDNNYKPIQGANNQTFTATVNGNYSVEITEFGCVDTSSCLNISGIGFIELSNGISLNVFPNPTKSGVELNLEKPLSEVILNLSDIQGKIITHLKYKHLSSTSIELPKEPGVFSLQIQSEKLVETVRIIKE